MIVVYTALFGNYDDLLPAVFPGDYRCLTDQDVVAKGWKVESRPGRQWRDDRYASRFYFTQSNVACPDAEYTIMHGANGQLVMPPEEAVALLPENVDIACFRHPHRDNVYAEAEACKRYRKDDPEIINAQMKRYRGAGFPSTVKLSTCIILIRRNTPELRHFERQWWAEVMNGSYRDQLSFDYTRWRLRFPIHYLDIPRNSLLKVQRHPQ